MSKVLCSTGALIGRPNGRDFRLLESLSQQLNCDGETSDIHFVFDTKMAAFHSQLELLYEEEYAWLWKEGHIRHYHVNDYGGGHMDWKNLKTLPMGKGHVDFDRFFEHIRSIRYEGCFTVESTAFDSTGAVDVEMLNAQFEKIKKLATSL